MDDYVSKPVVPAVMYCAVERFPAVCLVTEPVVASSAPNVAAHFKPSTRQPHLDIRDGAIRHGGEPLVIDWNAVKECLPDGLESVSEITNLIKEQAPELLAEIHCAVKTRDAKLLRRSAHTLKGSVIYFGVGPLVDAALTLENMGRTESFDGAAEAIATLEKELARMLLALAVGPTI